MKESMKHRLVGAAVLVGLGIIAWPVVFDTTPVREISQRSQIPAPPAMEPFQVAEPAPVALPPEPDSERLRASIPDAPTEEPVAPVVEAAAAVPKSSSAAAAVSAVPAPANDSHGLPEQWALQLGVFAARANALELRERAEKALAWAQAIDAGSTSTRRTSARWNSGFSGSKRATRAASRANCRARRPACPTHSTNP